MVLSRDRRRAGVQGRQPPDRGVRAHTRAVPGARALRRLLPTLGAVPRSGRSRNSACPALPGAGALRPLLLTLGVCLALATPAEAYRGAVPILAYHDLRAPRDHAAASIFVPAPRFGAQLRALAGAGYHGATLSQAWAASHGGVGGGGGGGGGGAAGLRWDGGVVWFGAVAARQYTVAGPVLERLGWP